jgi:phage virion morphogenesis protein
MANLEINLNDLAVQAGLTDLETRLADLAPVYKAWAGYLEGIAVTAFKTETSPTGSAWQALKPKTIQRKLNRKTPRSKNRILQDEGALYNSIASRITSSGAIVGTNQTTKDGKYSIGAIHQFGAPRRNIPARPFLPMTSTGSVLPQVTAELEQILVDHLRS